MGEPSPAYKLSQRLDLKTIEQIVAGYQAGSPTAQLAKTYRLSKGSILRVLHEHDVRMRQHGLARLISVWRFDSTTRVCRWRLWDNDWIVITAPSIARYNEPG